MSYETDQGTLQLLQSLKPAAAARLQAYLAKPQPSITFHASDFAGRQDIRDLSLEPHKTKEGVLVGTTHMLEGVIWRRGSLRVPGVVIPEIIREAAKGRLLEDIVDGAPFTGFKIISLVQDGSGKSAKLRIRCTAEKTVPIVIDAPAPAETADNLVEALLEHADLNIDAVAERAFRMIGKDKAFSVMLNLLRGRQNYEERLQIRYGELLEPNPPAHLSLDQIMQTGTIRLTRVKAGIRASVFVSNIGYPCAFMFEKNKAFLGPDERPRGQMPNTPQSFLEKLLFGRKIPEEEPAKPFEPTIRNILGFSAPRARLVRDKKPSEIGSQWDKKHQFVIDNDCTIGSLVNEMR